MKIIINAREVEENRKELAYSSICMLADKEPAFNPTVTWHTKGENVGGSLVDGMTLEIQDGMIINVANTGNA